MSSRIVPDDIVLKSFAVFRSGDRKKDDAASFAVGNFLTYVENGKLSFSKARGLLNDEAAIAAFIEENREILKASEKRKEKDTAGASAAPPPPDHGDGTSLVALPYSGLINPLTGKSLTGLFHEGNTVRLVKQDGSSICLQMPKPIPCTGADVPKPQQPPNPAIDAPKSDKPVTPPQPHRHIRRHHRHHSCAQ